MKLLSKKSSIVLVNAQDTSSQKSKEMKTVLIVGRLLTNIPNEKDVAIKNVRMIGATNIEEVKSVFENNDNNINIVIIGAGIELDKRLVIVEYIFNTSNTITVHMKDRAGGPEGFLPFINKVLLGMVASD